MIRHTILYRQFPDPWTLVPKRPGVTLAPTPQKSQQGTASISDLLKGFGHRFGGVLGAPVCRGKPKPRG